MNIFILEDDPTRVDIFMKLFGQEDLTVIDTCQKASSFKPDKHDVIFLDHDLGGRQMEDHEDCGSTFVLKHADQFRKDVPVIIHSFNPAGAAKMAALLKDAGIDRVFIAPFGGQVFMGFAAALKRQAEREEKPIG